jgi:hypothetical protein
VSAPRERGAFTARRKSQIENNNNKKNKKPTGSAKTPKTPKNAGVTKRCDAA